MRSPSMFLVIFITSIFTSCSDQNADFALIAPKIYTLDQNKPVVSAVAIKGYMIIATGTEEEISGFIGPSTKVMRLIEGFVYPGFVDAHLHLAQLGNVLKQVDLTGTKNIKELRERLRVRLGELSPGEWLFGHGWDQNDWDEGRFPTRHDIDDLAPNNPMLLERIAGHAILVNSVVLEMAGIDRNTSSPEGGEIFRDENGEPTGVFLDNAQSLIWRVVPDANRKQVLEDIRRAMYHCVSLGLTQVHAMSVGRLELSVLKEMDRSGELILRVYAAPDPENRLDELLDKGLYFGGENSYLTVRAAKLYIDGAMGSRGALLFDPYSDDPNNLGLLVTPENEFLRFCHRLKNAGFQVCTHAIGDSGNHIVLESYRRILGEDGKRYRWRIEHAQVLAPSDLEKFHRYGIIPSMQPTHATSDMYWAENRLGPERVKGAYAWRSILKQGVKIAGGSDAPVESANPLFGFFAAITRQDTSGYPEEGWYPEQCMSREEALRSFTEWADYAAFQEKVLGQIKPGMWADMSVFDHDIMEIQPEDILKTRNLLTIVGGKITYLRNKEKE